MRYFALLPGVLIIGSIITSTLPADQPQARIAPPANPPIYQFTDLQSRAVSQENPTGATGLGGKDRGNGNLRKGAPAFRKIAPGAVKTLCDIEGPGMVRHIWMGIGTYVDGKLAPITPEMLRSYVIRIYWDDSATPSVEVPMGDFFGIAHGRTADFTSTYLTTPEGRAFNCYFPMPFARRCRITFENDHPDTLGWLFYQVDYTLGDRVTADMGRFHASFRRDTPPVGKDYVLLDTRGSPGVYVGAVIGVNPRSPGWWGEGEMKFYIDGDDRYPTINGTGTEDYVCTAWEFRPHQSLYTGVNYLRKDPATGIDRFVSFYRFHAVDPVYFQSGLRVELQQIGAGYNETDAQKYGWQGPHVNPDVENPGKIMNDWLYDRSDDYCSTVFWYQRLTGQPLPPLPPRAERIRGLALESWETAK